VLSVHEGDGDTGGGDTDVTDENYGTLSVVASGAKGTSLILGVLNNGGDLIRGCAGNFNAARTCPDLKFRVTSAGEVYADGTFHASGRTSPRWSSRKRPASFLSQGTSW